MSEATSQTSTTGTSGEGSGTGNGTGTQGEGQGQQQQQGQQGSQQQQQQGTQGNSSTQSQGSGSGDGNGDGKTTTTKTEGSESKLDLRNLSAEQLKEVLENPELFKQPRIKELLDGNKELKKLREEQAKRDEEALVEQKKFEELANKRGDENAKLKQQLQDTVISQALSNKLVGEKVVDLDGALRLMDRSKVSIDDNNTVSGVDDAIAALKTDKPYLFQKSEEGQQQQTTQSVGTASNTQNGNQNGTKTSFKRSEIAAMTAKEYADNRDEILRATREGRIEMD